MGQLMYGHGQLVLYVYYGESCSACLNNIFEYDHILLMSDLEKLTGARLTIKWQNGIIT